MSDFEKLYGDVLITPEESAVISLESVVAALTEVALEVKSGEEVILTDKDGNVFRKQEDGSFHLLPKRDYVIMRSTCFLSCPWATEGQTFYPTLELPTLVIRPLLRPSMSSSSEDMIDQKIVR
jgi:hypothetical protein